MALNFTTTYAPSYTRTYSSTESRSQLLTGANFAQSFSFESSSGSTGLGNAFTSTACYTSSQWSTGVAAPSTTTSSGTTAETGTTSIEGNALYTTSITSSGATTVFNTDQTVDDTGTNTTLTALVTTIAIPVTYSTSYSITAFSENTHSFTDSIPVISGSTVTHTITAGTLTYTSSVPSTTNSSKQVTSTGISATAGGTGTTYSTSASNQSKPLTYLTASATIDDVISIYKTGAFGDFLDKSDAVSTTTTISINSLSYVTYSLATYDQSIPTTNLSALPSYSTSASDAVATTITVTEIYSTATATSAAILLTNGQRSTSEATITLYETSTSTESYLSHSVTASGVATRNYANTIAKYTADYLRDGMLPAASNYTGTDTVLYTSYLSAHNGANKTIPFKFSYPGEMVGLTDGPRSASKVVGNFTSVSGESFDTAYAPKQVTSFDFGSFVYTTIPGNSFRAYAVVNTIAGQGDLYPSDDMTGLEGAGMYGYTETDNGSVFYPNVHVQKVIPYSGSGVSTGSTFTQTWFFRLSLSYRTQQTVTGGFTTRSTQSGTFDYTAHTLSTLDSYFPLTGQSVYPILSGVANYVGYNGGNQTIYLDGYNKFTSYDSTGGNTSSWESTYNNGTLTLPAGGALRVAQTATDELYVATRHPF